MFEFGCQIADINEKGHRVVVGIILPTRAYASSLLVAGIVIRRALRMNTEQWHNKRFEYFWDLPDGTSCYIFINDKRFRGVVESHQEDDRGLYRLVRYNKKDGNYRIYADQAHRIQPLNRTFTPKGDQSGITIELPKFLGDVLVRLEHPVEQWSSSLECIVIGSLASLQAELELPIRIGRSHCGRLGNLLLLKKIEGDGLIYRSDLVSPFADPDEPLLMPETVVLMDGSSTFLEAAEDWPRHDLVVLLDPHDAKFAEAVAKLNDWWRSSTTDLEPERLTCIPAGVEVTAFRQRGGDD